MDTFAQFRTGVQTFYNAGADMAKLQYEAVADYVKSKIEREVNQDLERSKSYLNSWMQLKIRLAGTIVSVPFATIKPQVLTRITIDSQRTAIAAVIDLWIQDAMDELDAMKGIFDALLKSCCVDMQRKVMCYQIGNYFYFTYLAAVPTNSGWATKIPIASFAAAGNPEILSLEYGRYEAPLAVGAVALGARVVSNERIYLCVGAGNVAAVGTGLHSFDRTEETLGTAIFKYDETLAWIPASAVNWLNQSSLTEHRAAGVGPYYTIDPANTFIYASPVLVASEIQNKQIRIQYNGLKVLFLDADTVTFDFPTQKAAAHYVRGNLEENLNGDKNLAATELALYASELRKLWVDCTRRQSTTLTRQAR